MRNAVLMPLGTPAVTILDASGVLTWIAGDPGADAVDEHVADGVLCSVNAGQVRYKIDEWGMDVEPTMRRLAQLGVRTVAFTEPARRTVAPLRRLDRRSRGGRLSLGDLCCLALALHLDMPVIMGDRRWSRPGLPLQVIDYRDA